MEEILVVLKEIRDGINKLNATTLNIENYTIENGGTLLNVCDKLDGIRGENVDFRGAGSTLSYICDELEMIRGTDGYGKSIRDVCTELETIRGNDKSGYASLENVYDKLDKIQGPYWSDYGKGHTLSDICSSLCELKK